MVGAGRGDGPCWLEKGRDRLGVHASDGIDCPVMHSCDVCVSLASLCIPRRTDVTVHAHHPPNNAKLDPQGRGSNRAQISCRRLTATDGDASDH